MPGLWKDLNERPGDFGVEVPALTTGELWDQLKSFGIQQVDLVKLDCEGAEYTILPEPNRMNLLFHVGWLRGEWHCRDANLILNESLDSTHSFHIDLNEPHDVGLFLAHRFTAS